MTLPIKFYDGDQSREPRPGEFVAAAPEPRQRAGRWYLPPGAVSAGSAPSMSTVDSRLYLVPLMVPRKRPLSAVACQVATGGSAGAVLRFGIYADNDGTPGAVVADLGAVAATAAAAAQVTPVAPLILEPGMYWLAMVSQGGATTQPLVRSTQAHNPLVGVLALGNFGCAGYTSQSTISGALLALGVNNMSDALSVPAIAVKWS